MLVQPFTNNRDLHPGPDGPPAGSRESPAGQGLVTFWEGYENFSIDRLALSVSRITLKAGASFTEDDCVRSCAQLLALTGGERGGLLIQITGVGSVIRQALSLYSEGTPVTAFAILGNTPVDRVMAHSILRLTPPGRPTEYFTDEEEALRWLRSR